MECRDEKTLKKIRRRRGIADWDGNGDVEWGWGADRLSNQEVDKMSGLDMSWTWLFWTWLDIDMFWTCFLSGFSDRVRGSLLG